MQNPINLYQQPSPRENLLLLFLVRGGQPGVSIAFDCLIRFLKV